MAGSTVKIGADVTQFKQGMQQAQQSAKTLQAQMKANEAQFKATGDKEQYLSQKSKLLKAELEAQKKAADNAKKALAAMDKEGVEPTSREYQQMERALAGASAAMYEAEAAMNGLTASETKAAGGAGNLEKSLSNISTKVSLDAVIGGIGTITGGLENAAKKAVNLGKTIFDELMDSAKWADDAQTMAQMYGIPLERYLQMEAMVKSGMDTSVDAILGGMSRVKKSVGKESAETMNRLRELGLITTETLDTGFGKVEQEKRLFGDADDLFWKAGKAIMAMGDAYDQEAAAQAIFGKGWRELVPLFTEFQDKESFNAALEEMNTNTGEQVKDLAALNDAMQKLEHNFDVLKKDVLAELAPALTKGAEALSGLLDSIMEYLDTPEGKQMLADLGTAVEGLFDDLTKIDPAQVVEGFTTVFGTIVDGLQWMVANKDTLAGILTAIVAGWGLAKLTGGALQVLQLINGIRGLGGANGVNNAINQIANGGGGGGGGTPTTTGGDSGAPKPTAKTPKGKTPTAGPTAGPTNFVPFDVTTGATGALGASSSYAMIPGLSGIGEGALGFGNLSFAGAAGGTAILTGIIIAGTKAIRDINEEAEKAREVEADMYRFSGGIGGPMGDKRLILQDTVRRLFATSGETGGIMSAQNQMKWLSYNLNNQIMDAFNYTNTSGQSRNKLIDMLNMDPQNAAAAYQMLRWAGFDRPGSDWSKEWRDAYETGKGSYMQIKDSGGNLGYEWALMTIRDYFGKSGVFNENGEWTIPGLEEEMAAQREAAQAMNGAAETMAGLPEQVAAAVSSAPIKVELGFGLPKANGIWSVPWDGYPAILHKGERVTPAREIGSRSYNSNLYVESMYMNNGTDAAGLAAAMAAAQRRTMSGYGS